MALVQEDVVGGGRPGHPAESAGIEGGGRGDQGAFGGVTRSGLDEAAAPLGEAGLGTARDFLSRGDPTTTLVILSEAMKMAQ